GLAAGAAPFAAADAAALGSSPSCASTAMSWFTGTSWLPSGTTILASTPSSIDSYSMVALSVSISAMTSPALPASPSFLSHLARLPFSMVGESAGMRILTGIRLLDFSADRAGRARIGRRVHLGVEQRANALKRFFLPELALGRVDARDMARDIRDQHAPGFRIVEGAAQRHVQAAIDDGGAQHFDAAVLERSRRDDQSVKDRFVGIHAAHR